MPVYVILSNYFDNGCFGIYSTIQRARVVLEDYFAKNDDIVAFTSIDGYRYQFTTKDDATFGVEIFWDVIDAEFTFLEEELKGEE